MNERPVIGIDPGISGGIAILVGDHATARPMPVLKNPTGKGHVIEGHAVRDLIDGVAAESDRPPLVVIERQQPMPKQGVSSTFAIGAGYGELRGILIGLRIPFELVQARQWQKHMLAGLPRKDTKAASIAKCRDLYPDVSLLPTPQCRKPHDGLADALMIATYGQRVLLNEVSRATAVA